MFDRVTAILTLIGTISAGVTAFVNLGSVPRNVRLFIVGTAALIVIGGVTTLVARWCRPEWQLGFDGKRVSKVKVAISVVAVGAVVSAAVVLLNVTASFHSVLYEVAVMSDRTELTASAPRSGASTTVRVAYPQRANCRGFDRNVNQKASYYADDPDGPVPALQVSGFADPQTFGLRCRPPVETGSLELSVAEVNIGKLRTEERKALSRWFWISGGIVWLLIGLGSLVWLYLL